MQRPTLKNVRIRSTRDALQVFYGVATNKLPLITRRLDAEERRAIEAGNVYVWEERGANSEPTGLGMERWTDGMGWGPSRVRDEFLFYHQKESDANDDHANPIMPWDLVMRRRDPPAKQSGRGFSAPQEPERLIKQTYSVHVSLPADRPRSIIRKWHLTAYFSQQKLDSLETIDKFVGVGDAIVPEGWFRSARAGKSRRDVRSMSLNGMGPSEGIITPTSPLYPHQYSPPHARYQELHQSPGGLPHSPHSDYSSTLPSLSSSPSSSPGTVVPLHPTGSSQLVPLEVLQNQSSSRPRRDPVDEELLRRLGSTNPRGAHTPSPDMFFTPGMPFPSDRNS